MLVTGSTQPKDRSAVLIILLPSIGTAIWPDLAAIPQIRPRADQAPPSGRATARRRVPGAAGLGGGALGRQHSRRRDAVLR